ncbi:SET domain-containing protein SmydA-8-like [Macrobrachium nipponense]|uniref:SET domain-containing protein SmydA-8-like n=1 Tax=Macrobrachium nipponense TaxID=159736 RepID=UPI0030C80096
MDKLHDQNVQESSAAEGISESRASMDSHKQNDDQNHKLSFTERVRAEYDLQTRSERLRLDITDIPIYHKELRQTTLPVDIQYQPGKGRFLVARRDISAGELIFKESPLLLAPKAASEPTCLACLKVLDAKFALCKNCKGPLCSSGCHGNGHTEKECRLIKGLGLEESPNFRMNFRELSVLLAPLRVYLLMNESPAAKEVFQALQSHKERRKMMPIGRYVEEKIVKVFHDKLKLDVDSSLVHHICGVLDTNSYEVSIDDSSRARAIFTLTSMLNHSCLPNTQRWYADGKMIIRAATDIPKGVPVTTTYTQTLWGTSTRLAHLSTCKMFTCVCNRCNDPTELGSHLSSISCKSCQSPDGLLIPPKTSEVHWRCHKCEAQVPSNAIQAMVRASSAILSKVDMQSTEEVTATLKHLSRMLGRQHYIVAELKLGMIQSIMKLPFREDVSDDDLIRVMDASTELLSLAELIEPELSRFRGLLLLQRGQAYLELLERQRNSQENMVSLSEPYKSSCDNGLTSGVIMSKEYIKEMLGRMAECEFILLYDQRLPEVLEVMEHLREFLHNDDTEEFSAAE